MKSIEENFFRLRKSICGDCSCNVDFYNICAECPNKKWKKEPNSLCKMYKDFYGLEENAKNTTENQQFPTINEMAKNFGSAIFNETKAFFHGIDPISDEEFSKRIHSCKSCEFYVEKTNRCSKCGCFLSLKAKMKTQKCPIGKW